ncbi:LLM class flavin-dependent oxidoreductase, partial [Rhizobium ruizarguesonis]
YKRFWLAEHHGMPGIASAATSVVIGHVGAATKRIRIGSGGIMLPNHSPLVIAEQFGTLEALFPGLNRHPRRALEGLAHGAAFGNGGKVE